MSRRDALPTLLQLRRAALEGATLDLAARLAHQARADQAEAAAAAALRTEAAAAAEGSDYAAWLPRGRAAAARAAAAAAAAANDSDAAREVLRDARTELELATALAQRRAAAQRARQLRLEQAALDEIAGILHRAPPRKRPGVPPLAFVPIKSLRAALQPLVVCPRPITRRG